MSASFQLQDRSKKHGRRSPWPGPLWIVTAAVMLVGWSWTTVSAEETSNRGYHAGRDPRGPRRTLRNLQESCESQCANPKFHDLEVFNNQDMVDPATMLARLRTKRHDWVTQKLHKDYGKDYYEAIFEPLTDVYDAATNTTTQQQRTSIGRAADGYPSPIFQDPAKAKLARNGSKNTTLHSVAWDRLVRKWQIKILQLRINMLEERKKVKPLCLEACSKQQDAAGGDGGRRRNLLGSTGDGLYGKFVWATGGHSASAGHGNMFDESYTAIMGDALHGIFSAAMGLEFEAKNYAMGGTDSAEEIALCYQSVFGQDVDFFSWDYGMTDGHNEWKFMMYAYHAASLARITARNKLSQPGDISHRPAFFALHSSPARDLVMSLFQEMGMTTLTHDLEVTKEITKEVIPDTFGMNEAQIAAMPPYLQYFKCEGKVEAGEPGCDENKFNMTMCEKRRFRTSWHPGWKYQALMGNLMAVTLLDAAEDALQGLAEMEAAVEVKETDDLDGLEAKRKRLFFKMKELANAEQKDYDNIFTSPIPEEFEPFVDKFLTPEQKDHLGGIEREAFFKEPSFCHTALLPSEIRFGGFLTENFTVTGRILDQNYEQGKYWPDYVNMENPNPRWNQEPEAFKDPRPGMEDKMTLIQENGDRQECDVNLNLDFKDFWVVSNRDGTRSITVPNDSEIKEYSSFDVTKSKGYILACLASCAWGQCKAGDMRPYIGWERPQPRKDFVPPPEAEVRKQFGTLHISINGVDVTEAANMYHCLVLKNRQGPVWKLNAEGKYEIKMNWEGGTDFAYNKFSSFILM